MNEYVEVVREAGLIWFEMMGLTIILDIEDKKMAMKANVSNLVFYRNSEYYKNVMKGKYYCLK